MCRWKKMYGRCTVDYGAFFLHSTDKGFWACQLDLSQNCPNGRKRVCICNLMVKGHSLSLIKTPLFSGRIAHSKKITGSNTFIPCGIVHVKHSIAVVSGTTKATPMVDQWCESGISFTAERLNQGKPLTIYSKIITWLLETAVSFLCLL